MDIDTLSAKDKERLITLLREKAFRKAHTVIDDYKPYEWQKEFLAASEGNAQSLLMAGNRTGKTFTGAAAMSYHLTGLYPDWWEGRRYVKPINAWAAGVSNSKTRDIVQMELLGQPDDPTRKGTGAIPLDCIVDTVRLPGIPNAIQSVIVKHYNAKGRYDGNSRLGFLSYEMGFEKFMGSALDLIWLDEEPKYDIFSQCITRTADTGGYLYMTFTPETGMTPVVHMFMNDRKKGQSIQQAGWDDCPHLSEEVKEQLLSVYMPHERDMRAKGIPVFGSGLVFPIDADRIRVDAFDLPSHWPRIAALDFGWDHPTSVVWIAWDRDSDIIFVYDVYKQEKTIIPIHASAIKSHGMDIPLVWPHDGYTHERGSGISLADQYRNEGCNMLPFHFTNSPAPGQMEGSGGNSVEAGIMDMLARMESGRFKVFSHLKPWWDEFSQYHRQDGKIVKLFDDAMSATRYASGSLRFAEVPGMSGYKRHSGKISYPNLGIV